MIILGLGFTDHETSAALVIDGKLSSAIARERLTRIKRDGKMWGSKRLDLTLPITYCLEFHNLKLNDVDLIVFNHIDHIPISEIQTALASEKSLDIFSRPHFYLPHHFAHACGAFYLSPFEESAVLIVDGSGGPLNGIRNNCAGPEVESIKNCSTIIHNLRQDKSDEAREHESFYFFDGSKWVIPRKILGDWGGIGAEYGSVSEFLFGDCLDAGKTMGLAPYGQPLATNLFLNEVEMDEMISFKSMHPKERDEIEDEINKLRQEQNNLEYTLPLVANFAASIQRETEEALLRHTRWLRQFTQSKHLCFSGGVALNCVANSILAKESGFDEIFVPPFPGDDGISVGCAFYGAALNGERISAQHPTFLGHSYNTLADEMSSAGLIRVFENQDTYKVIAQEIADGAIIAWFYGGAEVGPRALGHRSFLADPRRSDMRDYINLKVKNRELFRPFAPVIMEDAVGEYFTDCFPSYFMSFVSRIREEKRHLVPAVTHIDGTARYQVLRQRDNPELYKLLEAFANLTGLPMLLNTSFNRAGEPLVETPRDAAHCAVSSSADYLVINEMVFKPTNSK